MGENNLRIHPSMVSAAGGSKGVRSPQPRARSRFRSEIAKLPLRFARAVGLECATIASEGDPQSRYLSTLSQGRMKSTEVLFELMNFIGDYGNRAPDPGELDKLSDYQLYNIYRNFKEHCELVTALQDSIRDKAWGGDAQGDQQELVKYLRSMCHTLEETRNEVEKLLAERKVAVDFKVGATFDGNQKVSILKALDDAWRAAAAAVGSQPISYIRHALIEVVLDHPLNRANGPALQLAELYKDFSKTGEVCPSVLGPLLTSALAQAKVKHPEREAWEIAGTLASKRDKLLLWKLFHPLYHALARRIDGSRMAKHELLQAIKEIEKRDRRERGRGSPNSTRRRIRSVPGQ